MYPENLDAFQVFTACAGQWEFPGAMGGRLALPFAEIEVCLRRFGVADQDDCFRRVLALCKSARPPILQRLANRARSPARK